MNKFLIQTNRVGMRPFQITDLDDLVNILSDREVTHFIPDRLLGSGIKRVTSGSDKIFTKSSRSVI